MSVCVEDVLKQVTEVWKMRHRGKPTVKLMHSGRWGLSVNQYGFNDKCAIWGKSDSSLQVAIDSWFDAYNKIDKLCDCGMEDQPERPVRLVPVLDQSGQPVHLVKGSKLLPLLREVR